jgi:hypothetical protein
MPRLILFVMAIALAALAPALGCPICDTATGQQVRSGIVDDHFAFNVVATLLPFPILIAIAVFIHFGGGGRRSKA